MTGLKDILKGKEKQEPKKYYWALTIEPGWVQASVWRIEGDDTQIIATSPVTPWEVDEELLTACDTALSAAIQDFPEDVKEPSDTVFGVLASWVKEGQIKDEYLEKIKKICSELSLKPVGFVVLPEAIAHFIKSQEGSPLSAILIGASKENIEISIFKLGKSIGNYQVARSLSVVDDLVEGLTRFGQQDSFPSRMILYDGKEGELEEVRQALMQANWDDLGKVKFLHTPKIEMVSADSKIQAVSLAGASELAEVVSVNVIKENEDKNEYQEEVDDEGKETETDVLPQELGFAVGKDVALSSHKPKSETSEQYSQESEVFEKKVSQQTESEATEKPRDKKVSLPFSLGAMRNKFFSFFGNLKPKFLVGSNRKPLIWGLSFLLLILIALFIAWWFYPKAEVTVYVSPKKLEERMTITIDPNLSEPKVEEAMLPGEILKTEVNGDKTKSTTGTKTVGDKATGEVTLYRVGPEIDIAAGTLLYGPSDLEFSLDQETAVASGSAGSPGTTKAKVTAIDIGAQYNLASNATFTIGNYSTSDIEAKNEQSFSGGSSREISAVSKEDQEALVEELTDELKDKAQQEFSQRISTDEFFIKDSLTATSSAKVFSDKVGDEASTLKLSLTLDVQGIAVDKKSLTSLAGESLKDKIPSGFVLREDQINVDFEYEDEIDGKFELNAVIEANLLPAIDAEQVKEKIIGKYPPLVQQYFIDEIPGFVRAEISFNKPRFPGRLGTLPHKSSNLEVFISAER